MRHQRGRTEPEIPDELADHAHYIEKVIIGAEDATLTHRMHPVHGSQLVIVVPTVLDLIELGRSFECSNDQLLAFSAVEYDDMDRCYLVVDTELLDEV